MIISKTPYRISLFGGGTDYPNWYLKNNGQVLSFSINKYVYISCRYLPNFFPHNFRILYAKDEKVNKINEITHPSVRETLKHINFKENLEIHYDGDLPARCGLGSSSAFTVGFLNCLLTLQKNKVTPKKLSKLAIFIEQKRVNETVGSQDQVAVAYGGINNIIFKKNSNIHVKPLKISSSKQKKLEDNLLLIYTGFTRNAQSIAKTYVNRLNQKSSNLELMHSTVDTAKEIIKKGDIDDIGYLLNEFWHLKKDLSNHITNNYIDEIYNEAIKSGALGGKLIGAGGGGFLLLYAKKNNQKKIINSLRKLTSVKFKFEYEGSKIIFKN